MKLPGTGVLVGLVASSVVTFGSESLSTQGVQLRSVIRFDPFPVGDAGYVSLRAGELLSIDRLSLEVGVFDLQGVRRTGFGGQGQGPGEYRGMALGPDPAPDGSLIVFSTGIGGYSVHDSDGGYVRTVRISPRDGIPVAFRAVSRDLVLEEVLTREGGRALLSRDLNDGSARVVHSFDGVPDQRSAIAGLSTRAVWAFDASSETVLVGDSDQLQFDRLDLQGEELGPVGRDVQKHAINDFRSLATELAEDETGSVDAEARNAILDRESRPTEFPAVLKLFVDRDGRILVGRGSGIDDARSPDPPEATDLRAFPVAWELWSREGALIGQFGTPDGFVAFSFEDGLLAGITRDELGRSEVVVLRVGPSAPLK